MSKKSDNDNAFRVRALAQGEIRAWAQDPSNKELARRAKSRLRMLKITWSLKTAANYLGLLD